MIPAGYGYEVLRFEQGSLRDIAKLPDDVTIVGALPPTRVNGEPEWSERLPPGWRHGVRYGPVFILICHRYCPRMDHGMPYQVTDIDEFISRYHSLKLDEARPLTAPDKGNQMRRHVWHRGDDGEVREYVWHENGGWVPLWTKT